MLLPVTSVFTDKTEFSRYHNDLSIITAVVIVSSPAAGATLSVALFRLDGYGAVATKTITMTTATQYQVTFDLTKDALDTSNIYRAKAGDYVVQVTDSSANIVKSNMFAVSIVPVREIKETWAFGVTFQFYEVLRPLVQPQQITGTEVTEVSAGHYKGPFPLVYVNSAKTLSWNSGPAVAVNGLQPQTVLLLDKRQQDFIIVNVYPLLLPTTGQTETLVIDNGRLTDREIIRQVRNASNFVQQEIITKIEPNVVDTDPGASYYDEVGIPETYYRPRTYSKWMSFKLPYPNLLDLSSVNGYFNQSKTATVPREWLVWDERTGIAELVPSNSAQVVWTFYNGIFVMQYLFNYASIPSFWHYRLTCGLRDLNNERGVVREAIGKKATLELLNSAGSAYRAGFAAQSTSRDGVSESSSYTASATFGVYGGHYGSYVKWLEDNLPKIKKRFIGIQFVSI
jgi:hypothetical protein